MSNPFRERIDRPCAWTAAELARDPSWIYELNAAEVAGIEAALAAVNKAGIELLAIRKRDFPLDGVAAFRQAHPQVQVHLYAAHHGFNCDHRGSWDAPSATLARERSLAFFAQHLG